MFFNEVSDEAAPSPAHLETKNPVTDGGDGVLCAAVFAYEQECCAISYRERSRETGS